MHAMTVSLGCRIEGSGERHPPLVKGLIDIWLAVAGRGVIVANIEEATLVGCVLPEWIAGERRGRFSSLSETTRSRND